MSSLVPLQFLWVGLGIFLAACDAFPEHEGTDFLLSWFKFSADLDLITVFKSVRIKSMSVFF